VQFSISPEVEVPITSLRLEARATAVGGQINVVGYLGGIDGTINPLDIFRRQVQVRGIPVGSRESFEAMVRAIEVNDLRPVIDRKFAWTEVGDALNYFDAGSHFGKIVLDVAATKADTPVGPGNSPAKK
jgi:NADPH:quinone reductase-like Zn-dependent oxidoreductase